MEKSNEQKWVDDAMSLSPEELMDELQRPCDTWNETINRITLMRILQQLNAKRTK